MSTITARFPQFREEAFVRKLRQNEPDAIEQVVDAFTEHLYKAALGLGFSKEQAQDLCHNTWTTFFEIVGRFEGKAHVRTFLFGILYRKASEYRRSNLKFEGEDPFDEQFESRFDEKGHWRVSLPEDPASFFQRVQLLEIIEKCMENLPEMQKAVFTMKMVNEEESEVICNTLGISDTNLRQLLYRGKNKMKDCIEATEGIC